MRVCVALFRGINVGGNHSVKMLPLKQMHQDLGLSKVTTLLQSGNVVFESEEQDLARLAIQIANEFEKRFGFRSEVMVRTATQLKEIANQNPFQGHSEKKTKWLMVMFLSAAPDQQVQQELIHSYGGLEEFVIKDRQMYIYYNIEGGGRSKLTNVLIEKKLKVLGTSRNWNTVTKLLEMTKG